MSDFLTDRDVADHFGISWQQVQARCRTRQWPHLRVGKAYRFTAAHLERIAELCEVSPAEATPAATWGRKRRSA